MYKNGKKNKNDKIAKNDKVEKNCKIAKVDKEEKSIEKCPYDKKCGSCKYQGIAYKEQLKKKQQKLNSLVGQFVKMDAVLGMDTPYYYRNKVTATFKRLKNGQIISGTYMEGTHNVVAIDSCQIEDEKADAIIATIRTLVKSFKIPVFDENRGTGVIRHVMIRAGHNSGQYLVTIVVGKDIFASKNNFMKELLKIHPEITSIVMNYNHKKTSMILGDKEDVIYGKGYIEDTLCGNTFRISSKSFYQINHIQTERLYNKAIEYCNFTGDEKIIDAYCGIGTIGITASKKVKEVIGVELNKAAVKDAIVNAKINEIQNVKFINEDAGEYMVKMASSGEKADVVIMDPPRTGSTEQFMKSVIKLAPKKLVYVSCNPVTLARDLKYLTKNGYKCEKGIGFDMFPWTDSIESVVLLSK